LDLASLASVASAAQTFLAKESRLDLLINNAASMFLDGKTTDGYELGLGVNHLGHALLTKLLLPTLLKTAKEKDSDVRIVSVASEAHQHFKGSLSLADATTKLELFQRYAHSKTLNIIYTRDLALHYPQILCVSLHPGVVATDAIARWQKLFPRLSLVMKLAGPWVLDTLEDGAKNSLWCAAGPRDAIENGAYYTPVGKTARGTALSNSKEAREELWTWTEEELKKNGY
jgi:NAD(P)-dependent dehydrogenase (short-subunit alcohol dehydrogenase family)